MAHELDPKELVDVGEMVMVNTIQVDTIYQLLIQKVYFTEAEMLTKMGEVHADYQQSGRHWGIMNDRNTAPHKRGYCR